MKQPLSDLAMEIVKEPVKSSEQQYVFESPVYPGQPLNRHAMSVALRGTKHEKCKGKTRRPAYASCWALRSSRRMI